MYRLFGKNAFDRSLATLGLICLCPIIIIAWLIATIDTRSNGFFWQNRIGKGGKNFKVVKIKTMRNVATVTTNITAANDLRITKSGAFFRTTKIDELPQLWNVLIGQMSLVGPRPDVAGYADKLTGDDRIILTLKPGITGPASLKYKDEEVVLAAQSDPKQYNDTVIWPDKVKINKQYALTLSFAKDLYYIRKTIRD